MSSSEDVESDKVNDLAYYTTSSSPNHTGAPAAIVLPAQTAAGWTQADLEHAAIGQFYFLWVFLTSLFCVVLSLKIVLMPQNLRKEWKNKLYCTTLSLRSS